MRIRLRTVLAGPDLAGQPGQVLDVDAARAHALLAGGFASLVDVLPPPVVETVDLAPPETTEAPEGRHRRRRG